MQTNNKRERMQENERTFRTQARVFFLTSLSCLIVLMIVVILLKPGGNVGTLLNWCLAFSLSGFSAGFLFCIPKVSRPANISKNETINNYAENAENYRLDVNNNLIEISDWLTKIIVGLGLTKLGQIPKYLNSTATIVSESLSESNGAHGMSSYIGYSYGILITFTILGFLLGYINTRTILSGLFSIADQFTFTKLSKRTDEAFAAATSALNKTDFIGASFDVENRAKRTLIDNDKAAKELNELIKEYNYIRKSMPRGEERTGRLTKIMRDMTYTTSVLNKFDIASSLTSADNGVRLSGYAMLYSNPSMDFANLLVDCIVTDETAFGQYWAIITLGKILQLSISNKLSIDEQNKLKKYYRSLEDKENRKYELGRILPSLKDE